MAQRIIEILIGRLITDEEFRSEFLRDPERTLFSLSERGLELSRTEVAALVNTDPTLARCWCIKDLASSRITAWLLATALAGFRVSLKFVVSRSTRVSASGGALSGLIPAISRKVD